MPRDINFGSSEADAKYQISDDGAPGDFVLARDTNGGVVLLQWNATNGAWEYGGPVDLDGNDLSDAGTTVFDASTDTVGDGTTSANHQSVDTEVITIDSAIRYVSSDSALDTAIAESTDGDKIILGKGVFSDNRTIATELTIEGFGIAAGGRSSSEITGDWTFDSRVHLRSVEANLVTFTFNAAQSEFSHSQLSGSTAVQINADGFRHIGNNRGDVTFASGTSGGIVDACSRTTVTDNGSNTVGDIA